MANIEASSLFTSGRSHGLAAARLFESSQEFALENEIEDPEHFAFNGTFSLSIFYLIGLSLELLLKAAYVHHGGNSDSKHIRNDIGHDLHKALEFAKGAGFQSQSQHLNEIVEHLREPYASHYFRYDRPDFMALPDIGQMIDALAALDDELRPLFWPDEEG